MNIVKIYEVPETGLLECTINNEIITSYNDLSTVINGDIEYFVNHLFEELDDQLFSDYEVNYKGYNFISLLLEAKMTESQFCKSFNFQSQNTSEENKKRLNDLKELAAKYNVAEPNYDNSDFKVKINTEYTLPDLFTYGEDANIYVGEDYSSDYLYNLIIADQSKIIKIDDHFVIYLSVYELNSFFEFYSSKKIVELINYFVNQLNNVDMKSNDQIIYNYYLQKKSQYYISSIPTVLERGQSVKFDFACYPQKSYKIVGDDKVIVNNDLIIAVEDGNSNVNIVDIENNIVKSFNIEVINHNYLKEIRILNNFDNLKINQKEKIDIICVPDNAEDMNEIQYSIVPSNMAMVTQNKELIPLESGSFKLVIKTSRVYAEKNIVVYEELENFNFVVSGVELGKTKKEEIVELNIIPSGAKTDRLQWSFDNVNIAYVLPSKDHKKCKVVVNPNTTLNGMGNIKCYDPVTKITRYCPVKVGKRKETNIILIVIVVLLLLCCIIGMS